MVGDDQNTLTSILSPSQALEDALGVLSKAGLIQRHNRMLRVSHQVQEAINHPDLGDLQESYNAAVRLVMEAFPKRRHGIPLLEQWETCAMYIHDGVHLAIKFAEYTRRKIGAPLKG